MILDEPGLPQGTTAEVNFRVAGLTYWSASRPFGSPQ